MCLFLSNPRKYVVRPPWRKFCVYWKGTFVQATLVRVYVKDINVACSFIPFYVWKRERQRDCVTFNVPIKMYRPKLLEHYSACMLIILDVACRCYALSLLTRLHSILYIRRTDVFLITAFPFVITPLINRIGNSSHCYIARRWKIDARNYPNSLFPIPRIFLHSITLFRYANLQINVW